MRLYYSNSEIVGGQQNDPRISLGGNLSATPVANDFLGNLFDDISLNMERKGSTSVKGLFLVNELGVAVTDLSFYFDYLVDNKATFELAAVTTIGNELMEQIPNHRSTPFNGNFVVADGVANKVIIGDLAVGEAIGLWFKRIIPIIPVPTCEELKIAKDNLVVLEIEETVTCVLEWL